MKNISISLIFILFIINTTTAQYNDPKWEFGAEVGFAWVGFPGQGLQIAFVGRKSTRSTDRKNIGGFRASVSAKCNLNGRLQLLGSVGLIKAKGEIRKSKTTEAFIFSGTTSFDEKLKQKYTVIEIPTYFRFYLLNERRSTSKGINIFLDLGSSYKIPIKSNLSFSRSESPGSTYEGALQVNSFFGSYVAFGISINNKATIAITSSRIGSQAKQYDFIKYRSRLKSMSLTVFF